jgi:hypothetical protein
METQSDKDKHNLFDLRNLNKSKIIWLTLLWLIAMCCCIFSISDNFTQSAFQRKYLTIWIIMIASTYTIIKIHFDYFRKKRKQS